MRTDSTEVALITPEIMLHKPARQVEILEAAGFEVRYPRNPTFARGLLSEAEAVEELRGADAVLAGSEFYTRSILQALPRLRVIARCGVGYDRVDIPAATEKGVVVTITPTANHEAVAEHALGLMLALAKNLVYHDRHVRSGGWRTQLTSPLRGQTLGIFGLGRIGRSLAVRGRALGMRVLAAESLPARDFVAEQQIELVDLDTLLAQADYLSLHSPLTSETAGMINQSTLAQMKPGSYLINTARGGLVIEADLYAALQSGHLRGAALDVFQQEPPAMENPLFALENVIVTPHISSADTLSMSNMGIEAAQCIACLRQNDWPEGAVVNDVLRATWRW
jgi:D-3-phosphoglycerate dehydrogenase / 2-oxoglutarate reductase